MSTLSSNSHSPASARRSRPIARNLCMILALSLLTACGFHLRNQGAMPTALQPIFIGGPASGGPLANELRYQLNNSSTTIARSSAKANYRLMLLGEGREKRIISLDRRGLAAEYGMTASVQFELYDRANRRVLGPIRLQEQRTVTNNPDNALTTSQEIQLVQTDINKALAAQLARRLGAYAKHMPPPPAETAPEPPQIGAPAESTTEPAPSTAPVPPPSAL
jgi:LPS-assembly lipoprotein